MLTKIENIYLLGTSHVSKESSKEIKETIEKIKPEVVAIELDYVRLKSMLSKNKEKPSTLKMIKEIGAFGTLFAMLAGSMQKKIAKELGVEPGVDMKTAYTQARDKKIPTALIDQKVNITLKKMSKMEFTKKIRTIFNLIIKSFRKEYREKLNFDVRKGVPSDKKINELLLIVKKEAPEFYNILIEERNIVMSNKLLDLKKIHDGPILAVIGAGHLDGMKNYLKKEVKKNPTQGINVTFTTEVQDHYPLNNS